MKNYEPAIGLRNMLSGKSPIVFKLPSLLPNSVYYPDAKIEFDIDGDPLRLLGAKLHSFIFSCNKIDIHELAKECRGHGCGHTATLIHESALLIGGIPSHWSLWKYNDEQANGIGFSLLAMECLAESAYAQTYKSYGISPKMVCLISRKGVIIPQIPDWFREADSDFVLFGGFSPSQGAYDTFPLRNYHLINKLQAQTCPGAGTTYAGMHVFHGLSWELSPEEGGLPRYPSRGYGKKLRLYRRTSLPTHIPQVTR